MMKIILQEDIPNLGMVGDLVTVKDGYGRNYLIPYGKAVFASVRSIKELEHQKRLAEHRRVTATADAQASKGKIEMQSICMQAKVAPAPIGEDGEPVKDVVTKLFGSITTRDLGRVLKELGVDVDHRRIQLHGSVRTVGKFEAQVRLDGGIAAALPFWVVPEGAEDLDAAKKAVEAMQENFIKAEEKRKASEAELLVRMKKEAEEAAREQAEVAAAEEAYQSEEKDD